jgi:hypothetical protein
MKKLIVTCILAASVLAGRPLPGADNHWAGWRGPDQGRSSDARVPLEWNRTENLRWQLDLPGTGNSSPIVWGERVFLTAAEGPQRLLLCKTDLAETHRRSRRCQRLGSRRRLAAASRRPADRQRRSGGDARPGGRDRRRLRSGLAVGAR